MRYVIIGNSTAAIAAIEGIRQIDSVGEITVISRENEFCYGRPLISYLLLGKTDVNRIRYRSEAFYRDNGVKLLLGVSCESIDTQSMTVHCSDNQAIAYDKLLVATGSSPFVPKIDGLDKVSYHTFYTLQDALDLKKQLNKNAKVLIIGAGLIGMKCVEAVKDSVSKVTVVDLADRVLASVTDEKGSAFLKEYVSACVDLKLGCSVQRFLSASQAALTDGSIVDFDVLVMAVGVKANISLIKEAGGRTEKGIIVNARMETTIPNVYAAGDNTVSYDVSSSSERVLAILPNAYFQGETAGKNMAGKTTQFDKAIPYNAMGLWGLHIVCGGSYIGDAIVTESQDGYKALYVKEDRLKGFIVIGDVTSCGIYTYLVREQVPLSELDFDLIARKPTLMAFSNDYIRKTLGGKR